MFPSDTQILVVDDSTVARQIIIGLLKDLGYKLITEATNGSEALKALEEAAVTEYPVALVISDLRMPKMSGLDLLSAVRKNDKFKNLPFLISSVETDRASIISAIQGGSSNYLLKPVRLQTLKDKLEAVFGKHAA